MPARIVVTKELYTKELLARHPKDFFIFGDNTARVGTGGQAYACRNAFNAVGISTKISPSVHMRDEPSAFRVLQTDLMHLHEMILDFSHATFFLPAGGLGTGLARMKETAPNLFSFLNANIRALISIHNKTETPEKDWSF